MGIRRISQVLGYARATIRQVLNDEQGANPPAESAPAILAQRFQEACGNVSRLQDLLREKDQREVPYSTLTYWVRQQGLRQPKPQRVGEYSFAPGDEMQHDTSPHRVCIGGDTLRAQCAGIILGYSRYAWVQYYPRFTRFEARCFLQEAFSFLSGAARRCTIDNSSVLVASGSGPEAIIAPEIERLGALFGTRFIPHAVGHPDRKALIERLFSFIEGNFLPGRTFADWTDLNTQAQTWCETVANVRVKRSLGRTPTAAWAEEKSALQPLPALVPPVYALCHRMVDTQGYVSLDCNRYSVPDAYLGKNVEVYKFLDRVQISYRGQTLAEHPRILLGREQRSLLPGHHAVLNRRAERGKPSPIQATLLADAPEVLVRYVEAIKRHAPGRKGLRLKRLLDFQRTYPQEPFLTAITQAEHYGLYDMHRLESLILEAVRGTFFQLEGLNDA